MGCVRFVVMLCASLVSVAAGAQSVLRVPPALMPIPAQAAPDDVKQDVVRRWKPVRIMLPIPAVEEVRAQSAPSPRGPHRIGYDRPLPALDTPARLSSESLWYPTAANGRAFAFEITSPGAVALRLGLRIEHLPELTTLRFAGADGNVREVAGASVSALIAKNHAAGERGLDAQTYWSPVLDGDTAIVEIELPVDADASRMRLSIPRVSHLFESPLSEGDIRAEASGACNIDVQCSAGVWETVSRATARMVFSKSNGTFLCTGTLLNDTDPNTFIPYFLSADHCISTQSAASSLQTYWFYRSTACNSGVASVFQVRSGGASLLHTLPKADSSFMLLNEVPPAGVAFAGWQASAPGTGAAMTSVHHPRGDLQKISSGSLYGYYACTPVTDATFQCASSSVSAADHFAVAWSAGVTEPGSSGSGAFINGGYLVGQLHGSNTSCSDPSGLSFYGRFDLPYNQALYQWLSHSGSGNRTLSVTRSGSGVGSVVSTPAGISCGSDCGESYAYGTTVTLSAMPSGSSTFAGWGGACSGSGSCSVQMVADRSVTAFFSDVSSSKLTNGAALSGLAGSGGSERRYYIDIPNGASNLVITTMGGVGDVDLFVRFDEPVSTTAFDCGSLALGNAELCSFAEPATGRYFVLLKGFSNYENVTLRASFAVVQPAPGVLPPGSMVTLSGQITNSADDPLCAMVLVNGAYVFSCDPWGDYGLSFPLDESGRATLFVFVDGFAPVRVIFAPGQSVITRDIVVGKAFGVPVPTVELTEVSPVEGNRARVTGRVKNQSGTPLCAMVLANGEYMFSCAGQGEFSLTVPRDTDGSVTLFVFVDSMAPYRTVLNP